MPQVTQFNQRGFTFVELLLVTALMLFVLGLTAPMVQNFRTQLAVRQTVESFHHELNATLGAALSGKSQAALAANHLTDTTLVPDAYGFWILPQDDGAFDTRYVEYRLVGNRFEPLHRITHSFVNEAVTLYSFSSDSTPISSDVLLFFERPFGRASIHRLSHLPDDHLPSSFSTGQSDIQSIAFHFQYQDIESSEWILTFTDQKLISLL